MGEFPLQSLAIAEYLRDVATDIFLILKSLGQ